MSPEQDTSPTASDYVLGLLTDPGVPARIAGWLADEDRLAERLCEITGDRWRVEVVETVLPLRSDRYLPINELGGRALSEHGWDVVVLVTDLPRRAEWVPILADYSTDDYIGMLSVPALGAMFTRRRALDGLCHLVVEHLNPRQSTAERSGESGEEQRSEESDAGGGLRSQDPHRAPRPLAHITSSHEGIDEHIALLGLRGRARLLAGMVRANRPWRLLPSLSPAMAGAAAGAAFGIFYSNIWTLSDAFTFARLLLVAVLAITAMIVWLIADNGLWERRGDVDTREQMVIANTATTATVAIAVFYMYLLLFIVALVAAFVVIPWAEMERTLQHPPAALDYAALAWLATSMGTIAGALGSGLADEDMVRRAAYSHREYQRRRAEEEESDEPERGPPQS